MASISRTSALLLLVSAVLLLAACSNFDKVEQGRVVAYDKQNGIITVIRDSAPTSDKPKYDALPPLAVKVPTNPAEMGPAPDSGKRLLFDTRNNKVAFFDVASGTVKSVTYTPVTVLSNVASDDPRVKGMKSPVVDRQQKTITVYSSREQKLVTFTVPEEYFALPDDTWKSGDEVRYSYRVPGQALRLMNLTKTNIMKG